MNQRFPNQINPGYVNRPGMMPNPGAGNNRFGGGFLGPFILGGITGGLVSPFFYGRPNYYPPYPPYGPYQPYYRPY